MPITYKKAAPPPEAAPTSRLQTLRNLLGTGVRIGSGVMSSMGSVPGALISGGGELAAEAIEGSLNWHTPARVGVEAGLGSIPLGKTLSAARLIKSAGKTGAMSGAGDIGRQWAEGNFQPDAEGNMPGLDTKRTLLNTLIGGVTGGVAGKFGAEAPPPGPAPVVIENMGGGVPRTKQTPGASVPAGKTTFSAGAAERGTDNYKGGVDVIHGYQGRTNDAPVPAPVGPAFSRVPAGELIDNVPSKVPGGVDVLFPMTLLGRCIVNLQPRSGQQPLIRVS